MAQDRDNSGVLFKNDKKAKENHPDMTGSIIVNGQKLRLAAWKRESNGKGYLSISVSEFAAMESAKANGYQHQELDAEDIPF